MDLKAFFLERHNRAHTRNTAKLLNGLSDDDIRCRPSASMNSIAWLLWHMARCEDMGINRLVTDGQQVLDQGDWLSRLRVPRRDIGTEMTTEEVTDLSQRVDISALREYWDAVGQRTTDVVMALRPERLDEVVPSDHLHHVLFDEGVLGPNASWVEEFYQGHNRGWFLAHLGMTHNYAHLWEANTVRQRLSWTHNQAIVRRLYEFVAARTPERFDELCTPTVAEGLRRGYQTGLAGFPDLQYTLDEIIAEDDKIVVVWTRQGTHLGEHQGVPPTGKQVTLTGVRFFRIADGKITETRGGTNTLEMLRALGAVVAPAEQALPAASA